jgi:type II secretory pathway component PulJ
MKDFLAQNGSCSGSHRRRGGYTLIEIMFVSALSVIVIGAILAAHLIGLRESQWVESKAGASDSSRRVLSKLPKDIRRAKMWYIGNYDGTNFTSIPDGIRQQGPALKLYKTDTTSSNVLYYFDLSDAANNNGKLKRLINSSGTPEILATNLVNWLTNGYVFTAENYNGSPSTNDGARAYKNVIHTTLQFCMFEYPSTPVGGTNGMYDFYKLEFRATPHLPE